MLIPFTPDRSSATPLHHQLYETLRKAVRDGRLAPGTRLASSRQLAAELGIARTTVLAAYDRLTADGFLEAREGAWTSVARLLPVDNEAHVQSTYLGDATPAVTADVAAFVERAVRFADPFAAPLRYEFRRVMAPALDAFPLEEWRRLVAEQWREMTPQSFYQFDTVGDLALRREITQFVRATRGIECDVDQTIITIGTEHAVSLLCRILLAPDGRVAMEDPSHIGIQDVFRAHGAIIDPVPVDEDGMCVSALGSLGAGPPRLVHVTPTRQYPTGAVLSLPRRLELLQWAADHRVLIIEDDYDSELSYEGGTLEALQALDTKGVVAYLGSFRKVLTPFIQIGYLILPPQLVRPAVIADRVLTRQSDLIHQAVLAKFMERGGLSRHLYRLRRVHLARRNALIEALRDSFGDDVVIGPAMSGLQVHVRWRRHAITGAVLEAARREGVGVLPVRPMHIRAPADDPGVLMAFTSLAEADIRAGVAILAGVLARSESMSS